MSLNLQARSSLTFRHEAVRKTTGVRCNVGSANLAKEAPRGRKNTLSRKTIPHRRKSAPVSVVKDSTQSIAYETKQIHPHERDVHGRRDGGRDFRLGSANQRHTR